MGGRAAVSFAPAMTGIINIYLFNWFQIDVIVTVEPCIMCSSALHQMKVRSIVYGAANSRFGGCESVLDVSTIHSDSGVSVRGGIFADEAVALLKRFYEGTNLNAPKPKTKKRKLDNDNG